MKTYDISRNCSTLLSSTRTACAMIARRRTLLIVDGRRYTTTMKLQTAGRLMTVDEWDATLREFLDEDDW